jgi:hypothetical protein
MASKQTIEIGVVIVGDASKGGRGLVIDMSNELFVSSLGQPMTLL